MAMIPMGGPPRGGMPQRPMPGGGAPAGGPPPEWLMRQLMQKQQQQQAGGNIVQVLQRLLDSWPDKNHPYYHDLAKVVAALMR